MQIGISIIEAKKFDDHTVVMADVEQVDASGVQEDTADLAKQLCHNLKVMAQETITAYFNGKGKGNAV